MTCPNCGIGLAPGAAFCGACGRPVTEQPAAQAPPQPAWQQPQQPWQAQQPHGHPPQQPQAQQSHGYPQQQPHGYPQQQQAQQQPHGYPQQQQAQQQPHGYPQQQPHGYPQQQPHGYPQQQPHGYPQQQPHAYPQQPQAQQPHAYPQQPQAQQPYVQQPYAQQPQGYPQQQQAPQQQPHPQQPQGYPQQQPQGVGSMTPYPIVMHRGMTRLTGHLYVAPARLYFICQSDKGGMGVALGKAVGGLIGGVIEGASAPTPGQGGRVTDESELQRAAQERAGSLVMDPQRIRAIKDTFWTHAIWFDGTTYALRSTLDKALKLELGQWCQAHGVKHAGLLPKK